MVDLENDTALITGADSGLGRAMADELAAAGANVIVADVDMDGATETVAQVEENDGNATAVDVDVTDPASIEAGVETATEEYGAIDVLCNNAGILDDHAPVLDTDEALWDAIMNVNLKGVYNVTKAVLPVMLNNGGSAVINTDPSLGKSLAEVEQRIRPRNMV